MAFGLSWRSLGGGRILKIYCNSLVLFGLFWFIRLVKLSLANAFFPFSPRQSDEKNNNNTENGKKTGESSE